MTKLFSEFNNVSKKKWIQKIKTDLKGNKYSEKLISFSEDIEISPIYHNDDRFITHNINFPKTWENYQLIDATNAKEANKRALEALQNDISGLCFSKPNNLDILLKNISIEHIRIDFKNYTDTFIKEWEKFSKKKKINGAFHGTEKSNLLNTVFAKGDTVKKQINQRRRYNFYLRSIVISS